MLPNLKEHLDLVPPFVVRRLAKSRRGQWKRADEIARESGLSEATVMRYARMRSWDSIPIGKAVAYAQACGHDLLRPSKSIKYLTIAARNPNGFAHLPKAARKQFSKLLKVRENHHPGRGR
jgi:hypothetical protein